MERENIPVGEHTYTEANGNGIPPDGGVGRINTCGDP